MRRLLTAVALAGLLAACSSSSTPRARQPSTTTRPGPVSHVSPGKDAIALVQHMLLDAVLPPGAHPTNAALPKMLRGPWSVPSGRNVVSRTQAWAVADSHDAVLAYLQTHTPKGYIARGTGSSSSRTERVDYVADELARLPANTAEAGIEIGVEPRGSGSLVNVVAGAQWTPVRPASELVGARDRAVVVRALYPYRPGAPTIRRIVVTGAPAEAIVEAFDELRVAPLGVVENCPALGRRSVAFEIRFAESPRRPADIVARLGPCGGVGVTVRGKTALTLTPSPRFEDAIARALGVPELHFVR